MKFFKALKYFKKGSKELQEANNIVEKLPENSVIAKDILNIVSNNTTKVIFDKNIKNSYYIYFKDTIYISSKEKNNNFHRCLLIAHECRHSIQLKLVQRINFILSNIELIFFILTFVMIIWFKIYCIRYVYLATCILSMVPRLYLELDAIFNSLKISNTYVSTKLDKKEIEKLNEIYKDQIKILLPISIITLFLDKIIRIFVIFLLKFII